jgi:glucose uptake protein GlcU
MSHWNVSSVLMLLAFIAFILGLVIALSVITKKNEDLESDRANTTRSYLLLLASISLVLFVLVAQRFELGQAVRHLMA